MRIFGYIFNSVFLTVRPEDYLKLLSEDEWTTENTLRKKMAGSKNRHISLSSFQKATNLLVSRNRILAERQTGMSPDDGRRHWTQYRLPYTANGKVFNTKAERDAFLKRIKEAMNPLEW